LQVQKVWEPLKFELNTILHNLLVYPLLNIDFN